MAFGAGLAAGGGNVDAATMFGVAGGAGQGVRLRRVVDGAVVTGKATAVGGFCGEDAGLLQVAGRAFLFKDGVGGAHASAGIDAGIFGEGAPGNPGQREDREKEAQPEFGVLVEGWPLEIVEVDALGEFFCCACSGHGAATKV